MFDKPTLIITHSFPLSAEDYRGRFIENLLPRAGAVPVIVLTPDPDGRGVDTMGEVTICRFKWAHGYLAGRRIYNPLDLFVFLKMMLIFVREATKIVKTYQVQHVFACWAIPGGLVALCVKILVGIPYSIWALGTDVNKFVKIPFLLRTIFYFAEKVYANSEFLRERMRSVTRQPVEILPTRSHLPRSTPPNSPLILPDNAVIAAFVGRLEHIKGVDRFLEIARRVKRIRPEMLFIVFGDGSLKGLVESAQREGIVLWAGQVSPGELAYYAGRIDALCITSREESMPVVVWEFMGTCPILSFDVGDIAAHLSAASMVHDDDDFVQRLSKIDKKGQ